MYKEAWSPRENKTEISLVQILTIIVVVLVSFVLPAQFIALTKQTNTQSPYTTTAIEQRNSSSAQSGQVAGVSTASTKSLIKIPFTTYEVDLNSETGLLIIAGLILLGISIVLAIYLLFT